VSRGSVKKDRTRGTWTVTLDAGRDPATGKRRQVLRRGFATRTEARAELDRLRSSTGRGVAPSKATFGEYLTGRWLPTIEVDPKLKPASVAGYRSMVRHLVAGVGAVRLDELSGDHLSRLYGQLRAAGKSERTVRYVHTTAHRALRDAARWRLVGFNAAEDADSPAQTRPDPKAWTPADVGRFLRIARTDRWWPLWRLIATTGLRRGEAVGLRWGDLDGTDLVVARNAVVVDGRVVEGTPKSNRSRRIALDAETVDVLRAWKRAQAAERLALEGEWIAGDRLFTWPDGSVVHPNVVTRTFGRLVQRAELPPLPLHNLRHAWATSALRAKVDLKVVSSRLGHASTRITADVYTAAVPSLDAAAASTVAGLYDA